MTWKVSKNEIKHRPADNLHTIYVTFTRKMRKGHRKREQLVSFLHQKNENGTDISCSSLTS